MDVSTNVDASTCAYICENVVNQHNDVQHDDIHNDDVQMMFPIHNLMVFRLNNNEGDLRVYVNHMACMFTDVEMLTDCSEPSYYHGHAKWEHSMQS